MEPRVDEKRIQSYCKFLVDLARLKNRANDLAENDTPFVGSQRDLETLGIKPERWNDNVDTMAKK